MMVSGRKWKILENAWALESGLGFVGDIPVGVMEKDGVWSFSMFFMGVLLGYCLGVLGKYDWGNG